MVWWKIWDTLSTCKVFKLFEFLNVRERHLAQLTPFYTGSSQGESSREAFSWHEFSNVFASCKTDWNSSCIGTDEGSLSSVKPCMRSQGIRLGKRFWTERATVGFLSGVNFQVKFKFALMWEWLWTVFTFMNFLFRGIAFCSEINRIGIL
jgi:hypothetical protein